MKLVILIILFCSVNVFGQDPAKHRGLKPFNIGLSTGIAGLYWFGKPTLEIKFQNFTLRGTGGIFYYGISLDYEPFQKKSILNNIFKYSHNLPILSMGYQHQFLFLLPFCYSF